MRYGSLLAGMAAATMLMGNALGDATISMKEFGQSLNDDVSFPNMSGHAGRSHRGGSLNRTGPGKRRAAGVRARKARRVERLHRHSSTGRKALLRAA